MKGSPRVPLRQLADHVGLATHQTQLYSALQRAYEDLRQTQVTLMQQERLRAFGQMASGVADDINTALTPAAIYVESVLEKEKDLSARAREFLINTGARMREFYRAQEPELTLQPFDVNQLI